MEENGTEKKDWGKVNKKAFEAACIAKSLWRALSSEASVDLVPIEIDTVVQVIEAGLNEIYEISGNHLP